jgi:type IV pilus assembly protein PilM
MIPWNPIHRYSGMTSHFDALDGLEPIGQATASVIDTAASAAQTVRERPPLGFVDVRTASDEDEQVDESSAVVDAIAKEREVVLPVSDGFTPDVQASADEKVPFYKREITFGRKKTDEAASNGVALESVIEDEVVEAAPVLEPELHAEDVDGESTPFYKRELSFRRKPADEASAVVDEMAAVEDAPAPVEAVAIEIEPEIEPEAEPELEAEAPSESVDAPAPSLYAVEQSDAPVEEEPEAPAAAGVADVEPQPVEPQPVEAEPVEISILTELDEREPEPEPVQVSAPRSVLEPVDEPEIVTKKSSRPGRIGKPVMPEKKKNSGRRGGRRFVGLKIGASQIAAAVVQAHDGGHELIELARTPLEPGIVLDGEVRDSEALVAALRSFFAEQKLPTRDIRVGISSNRIGVRTLEISGIDDDNRFDNAVRFKAHEVLPIAVTDSVLDYRVLEERTADGGATVRRVLLVVAPRDQVAPYVDVAQRAGLKLAGIDLESLGLLRAFVEPTGYRSGDTSRVVVAIGHEASTLLVSGGGVCEFTRVFDWGGSTLQDAIAQELQVHPVEAATILRHLSLTGGSRRMEGVDEDAKKRALEAVRLRLTPFARELVSSLQFYQTQPDSLGIGEIVITGGVSQLEGLGDALHQMIGVQVRVGDPLQRVSVKRGAEVGFEESMGSLAVAIGLAIEDERTRSVDLTPRDIVGQSKRPNLVPILLPAAAVVPLAAMGFLFAQAHGKTSDRESKLSGLRSDLEALPQPTGPTLDPNLQTSEAARASAIAQVLGTRTPWDGMLRDFARVLPQNVWLTSLKASVGSPLSSQLLGTPTTKAATGSTNISKTPLPPTPTGVTITGYTYSQSDVAVLLARLVALPRFQNVQLQSAANAKVGKKQVVQFSILADLGGAGGAA